MKKNNILLSVFTAGLMMGTLSSCNKNDIEIIQQDSSWSIDKKYEDEDIRKKEGEIPAGDLVYLSINNLKGIGFHENGKTTLTLDSNKKLYVQLTNALDTDVEVKFVVDSESLPKGVSLIPSEAYKLDNLVVKAGEVKVETNFEIVNPDLITKGVFELPIKIEVSHKDIFAAKVRGVFNLKCNIEYSYGLLDASITSLEGETFNNKLKLSSNADEGNLKFLVDGDFEGKDSYWDTTVWRSTSKDDFIRVDFDSDVVLKGLTITPYYYYPFSSVKVYTMDKNEQKLLGVYSAIGTKTQTIAFKEPTKVDNLILTYFVPTKSKVSLSELSFVK